MNFRPITPVAFPAYGALNVNMMPFIMGDLSSVPPELLGYAPLLAACTVPEDQIGSVGYLTVDEREVVADTTHRRAGLHTEGFGTDGGWGGGGWGRSGGLFVANTRPESCALYDTNVPEGGPMGQVTPEQIAGVPPHLMPANVLYWMHDRTPHESLPVAAGRRQFFRLVTRDVSVWYAQHNTPNRLGVQPAARVVTGSKFQQRD